MGGLTWGIECSKQLILADLRFIETHFYDFGNIVRIHNTELIDDFGLVMRF